MDDAKIEQLLGEARAAQRLTLSEIESKQLLEAIGIPTAAARPARSAEDAAKLAAQCGFPVVLKVLSPDADHKSDAGGVVLNVRSEAETKEAFERIRRSLTEKRPGARFDGVAVQPMAEPGIEILAG